ncbi:MAG: hydantoinase/oxoprolinase family protein [Mesorhizobium sp.]
MKAKRRREGKPVVVGLDVGGAHLKAARVEAGEIVAAMTVAMPLWHGMGRLHAAFGRASSLFAGADRFAVTMTGELSDLFADRAAGVRALLDAVASHVPSAATSVYAVPSGFCDPAAAAARPLEVASANWHATAAFLARRAGEALFVDMGSTTTDLVALHDGKVANRGFTDAERLASGELVYTGFTRTVPFAVAQEAPVDGVLTPLMNEFFASMADVHRILGVLDIADDRQATADGRDSSVAASTARLARMLGRDAAELDAEAWRAVARWFSERQLRALHDAAVGVASALASAAPLVGAGSGRWQVERLAARLERPFVDAATLFPARLTSPAEVSSAAPACAAALLLLDAA